MQKLTSQADLAKLFIPGKRSPEAALRWRWHLIKSQKTFPHDELLEALKKTSQGKLDQTAKNRLVRAAQSEDMMLDEVDRTKLFVTKLLLSSDAASANTVLRLDRNSRILAGEKSMELFAKENPRHLEETRRHQMSLGRSYLKRCIPEIRAKIAFQEIITVIAPNEMVPLMVSISPKYLACPFGQNWIRI